MTNRVKSDKDTYRRRSVAMTSAATLPISSKWSRWRTIFLRVLQMPHLRQIVRNWPIFFISFLFSFFFVTEEIVIHQFSRKPIFSLDLIPHFISSSPQLHFFLLVLLVLLLLLLLILPFTFFSSFFSSFFSFPLSFSYQ